MKNLKLCTKKSDKSKLKIALRAEHEKRKKKLFTSVRNFIDDKTGSII